LLAGDDVTGGDDVTAVRDDVTRAGPRNGDRGEGVSGGGNDADDDRPR